MRTLALTLVTLTVVGGAGCSKDFAVVVAAELRATPDGAGTATKTLPFGQRLRGKRWPSDPPGWLRVEELPTPELEGVDKPLWKALADADAGFYGAEGSGLPEPKPELARGWVRAANLVELPAKGETKYVAVPSTVALDGPTDPASRRGLKRYPVGAKVEVMELVYAPPPPAADAGVAAPPASIAQGPLLALNEGVPVGFIDRRDLLATPPTPESLVKRALERLRELDLKGVEENAQAALDVGPKEIGKRNKDALELLGQVLADRDWDRAQALLKERGPLLAWPDVPTATEVKRGQNGYVVASLLKLRTKKDVSARSRAEIPIGSVVHVEEVSDEWLRVTSHGASLAMELGELAALNIRVKSHDAAKEAPPTPTTPTDATAPAASPAPEPLTLPEPPPPAEGWVRAKYVDANAPTPDGLRALAEQAAKERKSAEEALYRQRLLALQPSRDAQLKFVAAAVNAGFLAPAIDGARMQVPSTPQPSTITLKAFYGCRGSPLKPDMEIVETSISSAVAMASTTAANACMAAVDTHNECEPTFYDDHHSDYYEDDAADDDPPPELTPEQEQAKAAREEAEEAEKTAERARVMADYAERVAESAAELKQLEELFPSSPKVRVRITQPAALEQGKQLYLASVPYENVGGCESEWNVDIAGATSARLPLPAPLPATTLDLWVDIEDTGDAILVVYLASDDDDFHEQLQNTDFGFDVGGYEPDNARAQKVEPVAQENLPYDECKRTECGC